MGWKKEQARRLQQADQYLSDALAKMRSVEQRIIDCKRALKEHGSREVLQMTIEQLEKEMEQNKNYWLDDNKAKKQSYFRGKLALYEFDLKHNMPPALDQIESFAKKSFELEKKEIYEHYYKIHPHYYEGGQMG